VPVLHYVIPDEKHMDVVYCSKILGLSPNLADGMIKIIIN